MIWLANGDKVLYQWSRGNVLLANTQFDIFRISREDDQKTVEVTPTKSGMLLRAAIPDRLMTESGYLRVACVVRKNDGETVAESVRFTIRAAQRPKDYVYGSGETADWKVLRAQMNAILRDVREGKFNGLPGQDGATPYIGENKHWYISGIDTGIRAEGLDYILTRDDKDEIAGIVSAAYGSLVGGVLSNGIVTDGNDDAMKTYPVDDTEMRVRRDSGTVLIEGVAKTFNTHTRSFNLLLPDETRREVGLWRLVKETGVIEQKWRRVEIRDGGYFSEEDQVFLPIRDDNYYDLLNCYVEIPAGATAITDDMITDLRRDPLLCGFVESKLLDGVVTSVNGIRPDENGNVTVEVSGGESSDVIGELYTDGVLAADDPDALMVTVGGYDEETRISTINIAAGTLIIDGKVFRLPAVSEEFYRATSSSYNLAYGYRYNVKTGVIEAKLWKGYTGFVTQEDGLPLKLIVDGEQIPVRHGDYYDIVCALIEKPTLTYEITQDMVTDVRGVERFCGYSVSKIPVIDETLTLAGAAADAKAVGDKVGEISEAKADKTTVPVSADIDENNLVSFRNATGEVLFTLQLVGGGGGIVPEEQPSYFNVTWSNYAITCGQNTDNYNAWAPNNLQYDSENDAFIFLQCHTNKHLYTQISPWTLTRIYPNEPWKTEDLGIPPVNNLGVLWIENGVWYVLDRNNTTAYKTEDMGKTWSTFQINISAPLWGIYKCNGIYYSGDDYETDVYYTSSDLVTWEKHSFGFSDKYSALMEASFCWFKGYVWAFLRTNDATLGHPVILKSEDGQTWELVSDQLLHTYRAMVNPYPFGDYIIMADIDRDNGILYYSRFDGETVETLNTWNVGSSGDDFHCPCICSDGKGTIIIEFMLHSWTNTGTKADGSQYSCENMMIIGRTEAGSLHTVTFEDLPFTKTAETVPEQYDVYPVGYSLTYPNNNRVGTTSGGTGYEAALVVKEMNTFTKSTFHGNEYFYNGNRIVSFYNSNNPLRLGEPLNASVLDDKGIALLEIGGKYYTYKYNEIATIPSLQLRTVIRELTYAQYNESYPNISGTLSATENLGLTKQVPVHAGNTNFTNIYPRTRITFE